MRGSLLQEYSERKDDNSANLTLPHDWIPTSARHRTVRNLQVLVPFFSPGLFTRVFSTLKFCYWFWKIVWPGFSKETPPPDSPKDIPPPPPPVICQATQKNSFLIDDQFNNKVFNRTFIQIKKSVKLEWRNKLQFAAMWASPRQFRDLLEKWLCLCTQSAFKPVVSRDPPPWDKKFSPIHDN